MHRIRLVLRMRNRLWIAVAAGLAAAISISWCIGLPQAHLDEKAALAAEDEVYETVVRDMVTEAHGEAQPSQLVFDESVLTYFWNGNDTNSCQNTVRKLPLFENVKLPYNTLA